MYNRRMREIDDELIKLFQEQAKNWTKVIWASYVVIAANGFVILAGIYGWLTGAS